MNPIQRVVELAGGPVALTRELAKRLEKPVTYQAVLKWARQGRLPRTEWTGETNYARALSAAVGGKVKVRELLAKPQRTPASGHDGGGVGALTDDGPDRRAAPTPPAHPPFRDLPTGVQRQEMAGEVPGAPAGAA